MELFIEALKCDSNLFSSFRMGSLMLLSGFMVGAGNGNICKDKIYRFAQGKDGILFGYIYIFAFVNEYTMRIDHLTNEQLENAADMLKAMAHPMRIAILNYLENGKRMTVTQIHEKLQIEQSTTSHHLGILKNRGVLASRREGKNTYYFLKHKDLSNIVECISKCACD